MKKINIISIIITIITSVALTIVGVLAYWDEKPRINATGEYSSWNTPNSSNFDGFRSYSRIDIRNSGDSVAKEIKLKTPFNGAYSIDGDSNTKEFRNDITLSDLNPSESYIVEIWSQNSLTAKYLDGTSVTHTRGNENVDFGYQTNGIKGWISKIIDLYWQGVVVIILVLIVIFVSYVLDLKSKIKSYA